MTAIVDRSSDTDGLDDLDLFGHRSVRPSLNRIMHSKPTTSEKIPYRHDQNNQEASMTDLPLHLLTPRSCRMARAGLGIYQDELARAAGVHPRTIKQLEAGRARPQPKTAANVLRVLVDRGVAFGFDGSIRIDMEEAGPSVLSATIRPPQLLSARAFEAGQARG